MSWLAFISIHHVIICSLHLTVQTCRIIGANTVTYSTVLTQYRYSTAAAYFLSFSSSLSPSC